MTQQDTQPPAETLAWRLERIANDGGPLTISDKAFLREAARIMASPAALTRRAGGDAIPAGWQSIETAPRDGTWFIADGGGLDRPTPMKWCARVGAWEADAVMLEDWDQQAEGYSRPSFWCAIPERLPTPKPPAGGDAGAVRLALSEAIGALQPFADADEGDVADADHMAVWPTFKVGDLRRAVEAITVGRAALALPAPVVEVSRDMLAEVMQDAWGEICEDAAAHPSDMQHGRGTVLFYRPGHWTDLIALRLNERLAALSEGRSHG